MKTTNQIDKEANEKKAKEIAEQSAYLSDFPHDKKSVMYGALEAMQWKDKERKELWRITRNHYQEWAEEQIAKEKQQLIDKAMKVICNGCAQKAECEFNNWKTCSTKDELIKSIKGE